MVIGGSTTLTICTNGTERKVAFTTVTICTNGMNRDAGPIAKKSISILQPNPFTIKSIFLLHTNKMALMQKMRFLFFNQICLLG